MIRKDVMHLADRLSAASRINPDNIYSWLMDLGRAKSMNPCRLDYIVSAGSIVYDADNYLTSRVPRDAKEAPHDAAAADFWENAILERQEAWMD